MNFLATRQNTPYIDTGEDLSTSARTLGLNHDNIEILTMYQPDAPLLSALQKSRELGFDRPVIILTTAETGPRVIQSTRNNGISGYIDLDEDPEVWQAILENVSSGWCVIKTAWLDQLMARDAGDTGLPADRSGGEVEESPESGMDGLTCQELRVVAYLNQGFSNQQIADALKIRPCTVKTHIHRILSKLNMSNRRQVAAWSKHRTPPEPMNLSNRVDAA